MSNRLEAVFDPSFLSVWFLDNPFPAADFCGCGSGTVLGTDPLFYALLHFVMVVNEA